MTKRGGKRLWVFDYDGTLSRLVPDRNQAVLDPSCRRVLAELVQRPGQQIAVLSSRALDDLAGRIDIPGLRLGGGSGAEWLLDDGRRETFRRGQGPERARRREKLLRRMRALEALPGIVVEDKGWSFAVHTRGASGEVREALYRMLQEWKPDSGYKMFRGPDVVEIPVFNELDKAFGVQWLCRLLSFEPAPGRLVYAGDDENDAAAMAWVLSRGGIAVTVGEKPLVPGSRVVVDPPALAGEILRLAACSRMSGRTTEKESIDESV